MLTSYQERARAPENVDDARKEMERQNNLEAARQRCAASGLARNTRPAASAALLHPGGQAPLFLGGSLFEEFSACLSHMGGAFFVLQEGGTAIFSGGNPAFLAELARRGIQEGTSFCEHTLGTSAAGLCLAGAQEGWLLGGEHWLDCMRDLLSYACWSHEPCSRYMLCVITPASFFSCALLSMIRAYKRMKTISRELYNTKMQLAKQEELFNQLKDIQEEALMLVDFSQKIICVNKHFEHLFELSQEDVEQRGLTEIFPELESMASCLLTGKSINMSEVVFEGLPSRKKVMYATCSPWKRSGIINGMVVSITNGKRMQAEAGLPGRSDACSFDDLLGTSRAFQEIKNMARSVAGSNSSIILTGESGTGKDVFAKAIHQESLRRQKPFVAVNCSAIPKELMGSELFGYGDGAFTGARRGGSMGKFEYANGGTLFLDEVAEIPLEVQAILLRVLEEHSVTRIGTNTVIPVDVRIISATNKNLMQMVQEGAFRLDLYYRLNVISLELPPLRKRSDDLPLLVNHYLETLSAALDKHVTHVSAEAMDCLRAYHWPGNIRQLRNVMERGINVATTSVLRKEDIPQEVRLGQSPEVAAPPPGRPAPTQSSSSSNGVGIRSYLEWERDRIWELMQQYRANKSRIAAELGISRGTLYKKIRRYGL